MAHYKFFFILCCIVCEAKHSLMSSAHSLLDNMESKLFNCILSNPRHVLYQLLYLLKRILDITCGNVLITLLCLSPIIIWSGKIFCTECYLRIPTRCMFYLLVYVCIFRRIAQFTRCIAGLFTKLMSIFVLIFMLSLSAFVRFLFKKLLACLLNWKTLHAFVLRVSVQYVTLYVQFTCIFNFYVIHVRLSFLLLIFKNLRSLITVKAHRLMTRQKQQKSFGFF